MKPMGLWWLFIFAIVCQSCVSIIIEESGGGIVFPHSTALFGPQVPQYNAKGKLTVAQPRDLCTQPSASFKGTIVLAQRGNCTFSAKAFHAQLRGAKGLIVGDNQFESVLIKMKASPDYEDKPITIPIVFVTRMVYIEMARMIGTDNNIQAVLDGTGEVNITQEDDPRMSTIRVIQILLLTMPSLWCLVTCTVWARRAVLRHRERRRREHFANQLPLMRYGERSAAAVDDNDGRCADVAIQTYSGGAVHVVNDSCVICLDDFTPTDTIKLLPCHHGFHPDCLDPWLTRSDLCPMCKSSFMCAPEQRQMNNDEGEDEGGEDSSASNRIAGAGRASSLVNAEEEAAAGDGDRGVEMQTIRNGYMRTPLSSTQESLTTPLASSTTTPLDEFDVTEEYTAPTIPTSPVSPSPKSGGAKYMRMQS